MPLYEEYLYERAEVEVETIKTLEAEPVMENPGNTDNPNPRSDDPVNNPEESPSPNPDSAGIVDNPITAIVDNADNQAVEPEEEEPETTEEFRAQLENVQKQLEALSSLPNTIQATIAALTEQLSVLAQPKRKSKSVTPRPEGIRIFDSRAVSVTSYIINSRSLSCKQTLVTLSLYFTHIISHICIFLKQSHRHLGREYLYATCISRLLCACVLFDNIKLLLQKVSLRMQNKRLPKRLRLRRSLRKYLKLSKLPNTVKQRLYRRRENSPLAPKKESTLPSQTSSWRNYS